MIRCLGWKCQSMHNNNHSPIKNTNGILMVRPCVCIFLCVKGAHIQGWKYDQCTVYPTLRIWTQLPNNPKRYIYFESNFVCDIYFESNFVCANNPEWHCNQRFLNYLTIMQGKKNPHYLFVATWYYFSKGFTCVILNYFHHKAMDFRVTHRSTNQNFWSESKCRHADVFLIL